MAYVGRHRAPRPAHPYRVPRFVAAATGLAVAATVGSAVTSTATTTSVPVKAAAVLTPVKPLRLTLPPLDVAQATALLPPLPRPTVVAQAPAVTAPASVTVAGTTGGLAARAVTAALGMQGVPYTWGGTSRAGVDCSGLTQLAYQAAGITLPRVAAAQATIGHTVALSQVQPGDMLFYSYGGGIGHVARAIGGGKIVEASQPGHPVAVRAIYTSGLTTIKRVIG